MSKTGQIYVQKVYPNVKKKMSSKAREVNQIKRDAGQSLQVNQVKVNKLESVSEATKKQLIDSADTYKKMKEDLSKAIKKGENEVNFYKGRCHYLMRVILSNRNDQKMFCDKMIEIQELQGKKKAEFDEQYEELRFQQQEMENEYKMKIHNVEHQVRGLREFLERRFILKDQIKSIRALIDKETKVQFDEVTNIHHLLLDQRDYYENDLRDKLMTAREFAKKYSDLHVDLVTKQIHGETYENRKAYNEINSTFITQLRDTDKFNDQISILRKKNRLLNLSVESFTQQALELKNSKKEVEQEMNDRTKSIQNKLEDYRDELHEKLAELSTYHPNVREKNEQLKIEKAEALAKMREAESLRSCIQFNNDEILHAYRGSANYVLEALDKKYGATDDPIFLSLSSPFEKLIRRLTLIDQEEKEKKMRQYYLAFSKQESTTKVEQMVQTEKPSRPKRLTARSNHVDLSPRPPSYPNFSSPRLSTPRKSTSKRDLSPNRTKILKSEYTSLKHYLGLPKSGRMPPVCIRVLRTLNK